jgi:PAS domain S-box-containing protein
MVDVLWRMGRRDGAIQLEQLWNRLASRYSLDLFCAYGMNGFHQSDHRQEFETICGLHSSVEVEQAETFLSSIIESADDAIVGKTLDGVVTSWNPGAQRIFGYSAEEIVGKPITLLIPADRADEEPRILDKLCRGERIDHFETQRIRKDGTRIDISLTVSPVRDRQGRIVGASKIARDITEKKRLESERNDLLAREQKARTEAESASRLTDEFSGHPFPRTSDAAKCDPRMGIYFEFPKGPEDDPSCDRRHSKKRTDATASDRGSAGHVTHHQRQTRHQYRLCRHSRSDRCCLR